MGKNSNVFSGAIQTHLSVISFSTCHNRFPACPCAAVPALEAVYASWEVSAIITIAWHAGFVSKGVHKYCFNAVSSCSFAFPPYSVPRAYLPSI